MKTMTEEEAFALDEYYTKNPPKVDPSKARIRIPIAYANDAAAEYLNKKAKTTHRIPADIIGEMVKEKIAIAL